MRFEHMDWKHTASKLIKAKISRFNERIQKVKSDKRTIKAVTWGHAYRKAIDSYEKATRSDSPLT